MTDELVDLLQRVAAFEQAAHDLLAGFETAPSRVVLLDATRKQIKILNPKQAALLEESLLAMEANLYRPAIVMAWAAFMDFLEEKMTSDGLVRLHAEYPSWSVHKTVDDLRDNVAEYQLIEASKKLKLLNKAEMKALHGLLSKRNECAHPSGYTPGLNEALGYVSELLNRIPTISQKSL